MPHLEAFKDAGRLVAALSAKGFTTVAASSAKRDELTQLLAIAGADALMDAKTSSDDARHSKPDPDIVQAALERAKASPGEAMMIGDTPYDVEAARRAGVPIIAFRCGGWHDDRISRARLPSMTGRTSCWRASGRGNCQGFESSSACTCPSREPASVIWFWSRATESTGNAFAIK